MAAISYVRKQSFGSFAVLFELLTMSSEFFSGETGLLTPQRRNRIAKLMIDIACLIENWSFGNAIESSKTYGRDKTKLQLDIHNLNSTNEAVEYIFIASNEFDENPANRYAREIALNMLGKLLHVYRVGDGGQAICKYLRYDVEMNIRQFETTRSKFKFHILKVEKID